MENALMDFRTSSQNENTLGFSNDEHIMPSLASTEENEMGVSVECSLKTCSTDFFCLR